MTSYESGTNPNNYLRALAQLGIIRAAGTFISYDVEFMKLYARVVEDKKYWWELHVYPLLKKVVGTILSTHQKVVGTCPQAPT